MTFLPIVERELRVASRRRATYLGRLVTASVGLLIAGWQLLTLNWMTSMRAQMGPVLFGTLSGFVFVYCLVAGIRATADSISEEKRDGTLGLLFLTDLRGYDVVMGKLFSSSLQTVYSLLAIFPIMAIAVLMGGISSTQLLHTPVLMLNTLFFSLAAGMLASAICNNERRALGLAFLIVVTITGLLPAVGWWAAYKFQLPNSMAPLPFLIASPGYAYSEIDARGDRFWMSLGVTHALSWAMLAWACYVVPRAWQDKPTTTGRARLNEKAARLAFGDGTRQSTFRTRLLDINPILWLASRNRMDVLMIWAGLALVAMLWLIGAIRWPSDWFEEPMFFITAISLHLAIKAWIAGQACRQIAEDRRTGALELLLATPLPVKEIIRGHLLALRRLFAGPILVLCFVDLAFALTFFAKTGSSRGENELAGGIFIGGIVSLVTDAYALAWVGLWHGLTAQRSNRAAGAALWRIIFLPAVISWFGFTGILGFGAITRSWNPEPAWIAFGWFALGVANDIFWVNLARRRLNGRFREVAMQRFDAPKPGLLKRLLGRGSSDAPPVLPN